MTIKKCYLYCRYSWISNRSTVDMHVQSIDSPESIDYVIIYILATLEWAKVSFWTLLITFYFYFTSDAWKRNNDCMHCRNLKCIHYNSFNFRLLIFDHKGDSICKTIKTYNPCGYICWYTSSIFLDNKHSHTISWQESHEKLVRYTSYMWYCVVWSIFNKVFSSIIYA